MDKNTILFKPNKTTRIGKKSCKYRLTQHWIQSLSQHNHYEFLINNLKVGKTFVYEITKRTKQRNFTNVDCRK